MKKLFFIFLALCTVLSSLSGCNKDSPKKDPDFDLSTLSFVNITWERNTGSCTETIYFNDDGNCGYYCACGEPVNDDDLCEGYSYDPKTETIYLDFPKPLEETVTEIKVISCDGETLVLDFEGDKRTFEKAVEYDPEFHEDYIEYEGARYLYLETPSDIFYYDLTESVSYEEDEYLPLPNEKWDIIFYNGNLFVREPQAEAAIAYYANRNNYTWSVVIYDPEAEEPVTVPITVSSEDIDYIYNMYDAKMDTTIAFDDIESFATLAKTSADGLISGGTSLAFFDGEWYWRSEIIDESTEGWPEYVVPLPESIKKQINNKNQ